MFIFVSYLLCKRFLVSYDAQEYAWDRLNESETETIF